MLVPTLKIYDPLLKTLEFAKGKNIEVIVYLTPFDDAGYAFETFEKNRDPCKNNGFEIDAQSDFSRKNPDFQLMSKSGKEGRKEFRRDDVELDMEPVWGDPSRLGPPKKDAASRLVDS